MGQASRSSHVQKLSAVDSKSSQQHYSDYSAMASYIAYVLNSRGKSFCLPSTFSRPSSDHDRQAVRRQGTFDDKSFVVS